MKNKDYLQLAARPPHVKCVEKWVLSYFKYIIPHKLTVDSSTELRGEHLSSCRAERNSKYVKENIVPCVWKFAFQHLSIYLIQGHNFYLSNSSFPRSSFCLNRSIRIHVHSTLKLLYCYCDWKVRKRDLKLILLLCGTEYSQRACRHRSDRMFRKYV